MPEDIPTEINTELDDHTTKKILKYTVEAVEYDPGCFSPTMVREDRRHEVINNCIRLCKRIIKDFGIEDQREHDYLLAKVGIAILGQGMLSLQDNLVTMDHEADLALEAKFGKLSDYVKSPSNATQHDEIRDDINKPITAIEVYIDEAHVNACKDNKVDLKDNKHEHTTDR
jgi:hypothetical protein